MASAGIFSIPRPLKFPTVLACLVTLLHASLAVANGLDPVTVQLKWKHQFQFAGYYAALQQGFFAEEGLDVTLLAGGPQISVADEVVSGRADYGVLASELVQERADGKPVLLLGVIFQHSVRAIIVRSDSPVFAPTDLVGKPLMLNRNEQAEFLAMFTAQDVPLDGLNILPKNSRAMDLLISGQIAGMNGSIANQPFVLQEGGVPVRVLRPFDYGIDFIGDSLFTSEAVRDRDPDQVARMTRAVVRGWRYAMDHPEEIVDHILEAYPTSKSRNQLLFEASALRPLILPRLVDIGHISLDRLRETIATYHQLGLIDSRPAVEDLVYDPMHQRLLSRRQMYLVISVLALTVLGAVVLLFFNRQLTKVVAARTRELNLANASLKSEMEERRHAQEQIAESERHFRELIESTRAVAFEVDLASMKFTYLGPQAANLFGFPPEHWTSVDDWFDSVHPHDREEARSYCLEQIGLGLDHDLEYRIMGADGQEVWIHDVVSIVKSGDTPVRARGFLIDVTRRKQAEEEKRVLLQSLSQAQKVEAIGLLAGGVAHDLNNLLTPIIGYSDLLHRSMPPDDEHHRSVTTILTAAERARSLVSQLLAFGRRQILVTRQVDLSRIVQDFSDLLRRSIREDVTITFQLEPHLPPIKADAGQLEQIIMNLALNAQDAMPAGGLLTITTGRTANLDGDPMVTTDNPGGPFVVLTVTDTGVGMDEETQGKVFDPFFTTKESGKGSGLGLSSLHGIVKQHGGHVKLNSIPGKGTSFQVLFPIFQGVTVDEMAGALLPPRGTGDPEAEIAGNETLLLVEDDRFVRDFLVGSLGKLGYKVLAADNGKEAKEILFRRSRKIDLVVSDVVMPEMSGRELYDMVHEDFPDVDFLFMSGYTNEIIARHGILEDGFHFIQKPFNHEQLARKIRQVLEAGCKQDVK
jgi:two-component system cell cycle sensor histidine kinase/response regulator CckA